MQIPNYLVAVADFGGYVNRAAVRFGGKSFLAIASSVPTEVIERITSGEAHRVDKGQLISVAKTCRQKFNGSTLELMLKMIENIHPNRVAGTTKLYEERIATPLTSAERRQHLSV